jgi:serine/threonine protein kinase
MDMEKDTYEWNEYILQKKAIGKGSYAKVYYGVHKETNVEIALKRIRFSNLSDFCKNKVISEISILQKLNHEHIIQLYDYKFEGEYIYLITEYCNQLDLEKWMKQQHSLEEHKEIMIQIIKGFQYLHHHNILHRDIKPQNILLHNGVIKICDFGFSIIIKDHLQMCQTICGTPLFMSPEILSMNPYSVASEIWSLGIIFYMMLFSSHPFGILYTIDQYRTKVQKLQKEEFEIEFPIYSLVTKYKDKELVHLLVGMIKQMLYSKEEDRLTIDEIVSLFKGIQVTPHINNVGDIFDTFQANDIMFEEDDPIVVKRGRLHSSYEETTLHLHDEYFTPPKSNSLPIRMEKQNVEAIKLQRQSRSLDMITNSFDSLLSFFKKK